MGMSGWGPSDSRGNLIDTHNSIRGLLSANYRVFRKRSISVATKEV